MRISRFKIKRGVIRMMMAKRKRLKEKAASIVREASRFFLKAEENKASALSTFFLHSLGFRKERKLLWPLINTPLAIFYRKTAP
jgi:hypothetical protein